MTNLFFRCYDLISPPPLTARDHVRKNIQSYLSSAALRATQVSMYLSL